MIRAAAIDRVMSRIEMIPESGCWIFMGALNEAGYGIVGLGGRGAGNDRAHRITYRHFVGETPKGLYVCHRCDVPSCCNPAHLFLGTSKDNNMDMREKGRAVNPPRNIHDRGEYRYNAKLTEDQVREIRRRRANGETYASIAKTMPVGENIVFRVANKISWKHVK
jgi:hypothetical protein